MNHNQELKALSEAYAQELPDKLNRIRSAWELWHNTQEADQFKDLLRMVHSLVGSGATFGFSELSAAASQLENFLRQIQTDQNPINSGQFEQLAGVLDIAAQKTPDTHFSYDKSQPIDIANVNENPEPLVLLISQNEQVTLDLSIKLKSYCIQSKIIGTSSDLLSCIEQTHPDCILFELSSKQNRTSEIKSLKSISHGLYQSPALIVISEHDDMFTRLSAVRAGALAYIVKPINISELVKLILSQFHQTKEPPYRILLVDDDEQLSHHTALILERAGMKTHVINDSMTVLEPLTWFKPELILLDLHMPECNGIELASVIRQQALYTGVSIVFFSTETDIELHIDALRAGGNDFFIKGLPPIQLITKVETKAKHARSVQKMMLNDPLTGLANRSHLADSLNKQLASCQRHKSCFAYVMLDLDHFKQINDQFGHQAGDQVLQTLASIITRRLRSVDTAIRYGGEEIVIILPDTKAIQATGMIKELLRLFSETHFKENNQQFSVTFSAGIADYPDYLDVQSLIQATDKALYKAKEEGRNRVCQATKTGNESE